VITKPQYIYRIGHSFDLSLGEYRTLTSQNELWIAQNWLASNVLIDTNQTGGLVFGIGNIELLDNNSVKPNRSEFIEYLQKHPQLVQKKLVIATNILLTKKILIPLKEMGYKQINLIPNKALPNIGHFKQKSTIICYFKLDNQTSFLGNVINFANQQIWTDLDTNPQLQDMDRGMINYKLARTMLNLASNKNYIWDPFCGLGRNMLAGSGFSKDWLLSDIDGSCKDFVESNGRYLAEINTKYSYFESLPSYQFGPLDIRDFDQALKVYNKRNQTDQSYTVVTEGYLGSNLAGKYNRQDPDKQIETVQQIWNKALVTFSKLKVPEIVLSVPWYKLKTGIIAPDYFLEVINKSDYQLVQLLPDKDYILYARETTTVGHGVFKLIRR
jgi:tRNA G10  N-methylase Trm11